MTNRDKYLSEILAEYMYNELDDEEIVKYGVKQDEYGDITHYQITEWLEQEYKPLREENEKLRQEYKSDFAKYVKEKEKECEPSEEEVYKPINYIEQFMKNNDLEVGVEFGIIGYGMVYKFTPEYKLITYNGLSVDSKLNRLLSGTLKLSKMEQPIDWDIMAGIEIEISNDGEQWYERKFICKLREYFMCENNLDEAPTAWKYARLIRE